MEDGRDVTRALMPAGPAAETRPGGPLAILCATALMAFQDAVVQLLSSEIPLWQLFVLRSMLVIPILAALLARQGAERLRPVLSLWVLIRSALIVAMYVCFYAALPVLDLSTVAAVYYTGPLFIVLFSGLILRETIAVSQVLAVMVAFCGVLIVLRPASDGFAAAALLPLASALCYALAAVTTRGRTGIVDPWALTLSLNVVFLVTGAIGILALHLLDPSASHYPFLLTAWSPLDAAAAAVACLLAAVSIGIHVFLARAYQLGPTAIVAGLDFSYLVFAGVWALLLLGTVPTGPTVVGTILIGAAGLWGMRDRRRRAPPAEPPR